MQMQMIKMPLACLALVGYAYFYYRKKKRLRTEASHYFDGLAMTAFVHLIADTVTEYTVNNRDRVPELFNYIWHIVFLLTIITMCLLVYFYLLTYVERGVGRRKTAERRAAIVVWVLDMAAIVALPIAYIDTPYGSYSLGPKAYALYAGVIYIMVLMLYNLFRYWKDIDGEKRVVMLLSIVIFVSVSVVQMIFPYVLLTGAAMSLITMGIMTSVEDSNQYLDVRTGFYNELGCRALLEELLFQRGAFEILVYVVFGPAEQTQQAIGSAGEHIQKNCHGTCTLLAENLLVALPMPLDMGRKSHLPDSMPAFFQPASVSKEYSKTFLCRPGQTVEEILEGVHQYKMRLEETELYRDELTGLLRRGAFIQKVVEFLDREDAFAMLMLDVDNFKGVNDTYGHMVGDDILRGVAKAFQVTLRERDVICRIGGDEFAIILARVSDETLLDEILGRLSRAVSDVPAELGLHFPVQLSIGVKIRQKGEKCTFDNLYEASDTALYRAKKKGKNCYVVLKE